MTTQAARAPSLAGILTITSSSVLVATFILFGQIEHASRIWGAALILLAVVLLIWKLRAREGLSLPQLDSWAWAIMISHTVIIHVPRDLRILQEDFTPTTEIALQVATWTGLMAYAMARLARDLSRLNLLRGPVARFATLFFVLGLVSATWAISPLITLAWSFKLGITLLLCLLLFDPMEPRASLFRFMSATQLGLMLMVVQFIVIAMVSPESAVNTNDLSGIWRAGGEVIPPTQLSTVAGMVAVLQLIDYLASPRLGKALVLFLISAVIMAATLGRGGIFAAGLTMLFVLAAFRRMRYAALFAGIFIAAVSVLPTLGDYSSEILTRRQRDQDLWSLTGRTHVWASTLDLFGERPVLGWGYVSGGRIGLLRPFNGWYAGGAHNAYLETLLALGISGALILAVLLGRIVFRLAAALRRWWHAREPDARAVLVLKLAAILICLLLEGMFESGFSGPPRFEATILFGVAFSCDAIAQLGRRDPMTQNLS